MTDDRIAAALDEIRDGDLCEVAAKIPSLVAAIEGVLALAAKAEHGALRWEDPLPVPEWVPRVREAISAGLLREH